MISITYYCALSLATLSTGKFYFYKLFNFPYNNNNLKIITVTTASNLPATISRNYKHNFPIINGEHVPIEEYPYQVSLQIKETNSHFCGGSIITPNTILTAAHCLIHFDGDMSHIQIRAGSSIHTHGGQLIDVQKCVIHNDYNSNELDNDIAIVILEKSLDISQPGVSVINLPEQDDAVAAGTMGTVSGWGITHPIMGSASKWLLAINVSVETQQYCQFFYFFTTITNNVICAGNKNLSFNGVCDGDSGGAFVIDKKLIGITVASIKPCGLPFVPQIFTRVGRYIEWINKTLSLNN